MKSLPLLLLLTACTTTAIQPTPMTLDYDTNVDAGLQRDLERIDGTLRAKHAMAGADTAVGLIDLETGRVAMIHPDRIEYAASVPKLGILFAWFQLHPEAAGSLDATTRRELGLMAKASSNEMAAKYSRAMGLREIQNILNQHGFYDAQRGGGIWVGKHYGPNSERIGDPVADHSHAATVRQLLRFYLLLDQGRLVSPEASRTMREILASPDIPHDDLKFVRALKDRNVTILRKWGSWEEWLHDTALVTGPNRRYILVALTHHENGDVYLEDLARNVDDLLQQ